MSMLEVGKSYKCGNYTVEIVFIHEGSGHYFSALGYCPKLDDYEMFDPDDGQPLGRVVMLDTHLIPIPTISTELSSKIASVEKRLLELQEELQQLKQS